MLLEKTWVTHRLQLIKLNRLHRNVTTCEVIARTGGFLLTLTNRGYTLHLFRLHPTLSELCKEAYAPVAEFTAKNNAGNEKVINSLSRLSEPQHCTYYQVITLNHYIMKKRIGRIGSIALVLFALLCYTHRVEAQTCAVPLTLTVNDCNNYSVNDSVVWLTFNSEAELLGATSILMSHSAVPIQSPRQNSLQERAHRSLWFKQDLTIGTTL